MTPLLGFKSRSDSFYSCNDLRNAGRYPETPNDVPSVKDAISSALDQASLILIHSIEATFTFNYANIVHDDSVEWDAINLALDCADEIGVAHEIVQLLAAIIFYRPLHHAGSDSYCSRI